MAGGGDREGRGSSGPPCTTATPPGALPSVRRLLPCPQEVLLKRAADLAEALYGVPSGSQVWRLRPASPRRGPLLPASRRPPAARPCPLLSSQELLLKRGRTWPGGLCTAPPARRRRSDP